MLNIRYKEKINTWPGFVDLFSNLVIILIFLLIVFVFLWTTTSVFNKNSGVRAVANLRQENAEQAELIEQMKSTELQAKQLLLAARDQLNSNEVSFADLSNAYEMKLQEQEQQTLALQAQVDELQAKSNLTTKYEEKIAELEKQVAHQKNERANLIGQIDKLQQQLDSQAEVQTEIAMAEIAKLQQKLTNAQAEYTKMSNQLNQELEDKIAELNEMAQYQSAFYRAIKEALGDRTIMRPDGDRFIISSDILFASGKHTLSTDGKKQLAAIANVIKDFETKIDPTVKWIIRVDGHTDNKQVVPGTHGYNNNLQLSILRANAVVEELAKNGVSRRRLVPSGFGDLHPIDLGNTPAALQKNRRIELQLTNR